MSGTDYIITAGSPKWTLGTDGFYYYSASVAPGDLTDVLIASIVQKDTAPDGYSLAVHVAATAIQSEPASAVSDAWGVQILSNGGLVAP